METKLVHLSSVVPLVGNTTDGQDKVITLPHRSPAGHNKKPPNPRLKRVITHTERWQHVSEQQDDMLPQWLDETKSPETDAKIVHRQLLNKIAGYKSQDQHKNLFDPENFVTFQDVLTLLNSNMTCYYCKDPVLVLYDFVREPRQWTLERLNNNVGHNRDNVVLACLQCNLRRRTMLSSKYVQTQEMKKVVKV
jgi:hypothetical protein